MTEDRAPYIVPPKFCYSLDGEEYTGPFDTCEEALAEVGAIVDDVMPGETRTVYTGRILEASAFLAKRGPFMVDRLIQDADEWLFEDIRSDDSIIELDEAGRQDLARLIVDFLTTRATFNRWGVADVQEHQVKVTY